jgi:hypothetical protein
MSYTHSIAWLALTLSTSLTAAGCGGSSTPPTAPVLRAALQVTASPSPVALATCPPASCGTSAPAQFEIATTLTVREAGGVAGRIDSLGITLRRNNDNVTLLTTTINPPSVQVRFAANGTVTVPIAFHHAQEEITAQTTATIVVNATGDSGGTVSATLTLPVGGPPTRSGLFITGNYQIAQAAVTNTCGDTAAPPAVTGWVTLAGPDAFQLRDTGGTTFTGTVQDDGRFVATAVFGPDSGGQTYTQRLEGTFGSAGFTGVLSVSVQPRNCAFTRNWTATRVN